MKIYKLAILGISLGLSATAFAAYCPQPSEILANKSQSFTGQYGIHWSGSSQLTANQPNSLLSVSLQQPLDNQTKVSIAKCTYAAGTGTAQLVGLVKNYLVPASHYWTREQQHIGSYNCVGNRKACVFIFPVKATLVHHH